MSGAGPVISVRGEARLLVPPDDAVLHATVSRTETGKPAALRAVAADVSRLTGELAEQGAVPYAVGERAALTWSVRSAVTSAEVDYDPQTGRGRQTGRVTASADVAVTVRELDRLDAVGALLAGHGSLHVSHVEWRVDHDDPGWREVRAAAVQAAVARAADYAQALGGRLDRVEQLSDVGLLQEQHVTGSFRMAAMSSAEDAPEVPSLDPVPQELVARVDARFTTTGAGLPG